MMRAAKIVRLAHAWARYPVITSAQISCDGKFLAWSWSGLADAAQVWLAPADGSAPPRQMTSGREAFFVRGFTRSNDLILAQSIDYDEHDRLFLLPRSPPGTAPRALTPPQWDHYLYGGDAHRDGRTLLFTADADYLEGKEAPGSCVYALDLASGAMHILARAVSVTDKGAVACADGDLVLYHRAERHPAGCQPWLVGIDGSDDREILNFGDRYKCRAQWLGEKRLILFLAESESHECVGLYDPDNGTIRWLIDDRARSIEAIVAGHDGTRAAIVDFRDGRLAATILEIATGAERPLATPGASLLPIAELPGGDWIAERYNSRAAHDLVRVDPGSGGMRNLTDTARHIDLLPGDFIPAQDFRWRADDGQAIQGWLYEPRGESRGLILWVHGGPTWHSEDWVNPVIQFLVGAGFTVLDPNYRGSTGFGLAFREAIKHQGWGGAEQDDLRAGILALIAAGKAERGRIGVAGLSYGGYSAWCAITRAADLVDAAMPVCGMYELGLDYHATGMRHGRLYSEEMMGGTPEAMPQQYFNASPRNFIGNLKGRLLIVHGLADSNVSPANTRLACRDLDAAGIPYELLTFPDEGHGICHAGNRELWLRASADFFARAFKG